MKGAKGIFDKYVDSQLGKQFAANLAVHDRFAILNNQKSSHTAVPYQVLVSTECVARSAVAIKLWPRKLQKAAVKSEEILVL